jgi:hypothetical protein
MSEQLKHHGPEQELSGEAAELLAERGREQLDKLEHQAEHSGEREQNVAEARASLERHAETQAEQEKPATETQAERPAGSGLDRLLSYKHTMASLQRTMQPASRAFSEFIHQPTVEQVSEVAANTVFRPSVTLGASTTAFLLGGALYIVARHYGYGWRGSSVFLISLVIGGVIGYVVELIGRLFPKR